MSSHIKLNDMIAIHPGSYLSNMNLLEKKSLEEDIEILKKNQDFIRSIMWTGIPSGMAASNSGSSIFTSALTCISSCILCQPCCDEDDEFSIEVEKYLSKKLESDVMTGTKQLDPLRLARLQSKVSALSKELKTSNNQELIDTREMFQKVIDTHTVGTKKML